MEDSIIKKKLQQVASYRSRFLQSTSLLQSGHNADEKRSHFDWETTPVVVEGSCLDAEKYETAAAVRTTTTSTFPQLQWGHSSTPVLEGGSYSKKCQDWNCQFIM